MLFKNSGSSPEAYGINPIHLPERRLTKEDVTLSYPVAWRDRGAGMPEGRMTIGLLGGRRFPVRVKCRRHGLSSAPVIEFLVLLHFHQCNPSREGVS